MENALEAALPIFIVTSFALGLVLERRFPGRPLPPVKRWLGKGLFFFGLAFALNGVLPAIIATIVGERAPFDLSGLGAVGGGIVGFLVADLVGYGLHRIMHRVPFVWRWVHQMHHSAERMDLAGMSYSHPIDLALVFVLTGLATGVLGLSPAAGAIAGLLSFCYALFQHMNLATPAWLGYVIMRPEAHAVHHERGVHAYNYGSFPLWDILGGTFRNPVGFPQEYGFYEGASARMGAMLVGRDIGEPVR